MNMTTDRLEPAHIKQLLLYAPDDAEVKQYEQFDQDPAKLSEPDQFIFQVHQQKYEQTKAKALRREMKRFEKMPVLHGSDADGAWV